VEQGYWFKSDQFKITEGEDEETNPGCYGESLAEWLCSKFSELGYEAEVIPEDWGWCVMCHCDEYMLWLGCGSMQTEEVLEVPVNPRDVVWHVFPVLEIPFFKFKSKIKKMMGRLDTVTPLEKFKRELVRLLDKEQTIELCDEP